MKILAYDNLKSEKSAVALGKFQGLHRGHMLLINKIVELSKEFDIASVVLTVNVPSDKVINVPCERFTILEKTGVDIAAECEFSPEFAALTPDRFVKEILIEGLGAKYVVVGEDFRFGTMRSGDVNTLKLLGDRYGFKVISIKKLKEKDSIISTSLIKTFIENGQMEKACEFMGRSYAISGNVVHGRELGRKIGFPTINIIPQRDKLLPPDGVYKSHVFIDEVMYTGITNIGRNPTIDEENSLSVETNILGYEGDLYGEKITVYIDNFLREEIKFNSVDELKIQLEKDKKSVLHQ